MRYQWDETKNTANRRKHHGISFEAAIQVFDDPECLVFPDRVDQATGEMRWHALGVSPVDPHRAVLLVVHVYREYKDDEEIIRLISARRASKRERRIYQEEGSDR